MPIGYIGSLSTLQTGNQQVVNSLVGLGQQIGQAINTHAAQQSAQAMLPMLQQQYRQGMAKIASGDPNGIGDVYGASMIASQNPLLAPMAGHAINLANAANIQTQHTLRTQAAQQGAMQRYNLRYGQGAQGGTAGGAKPMTGGQQAAQTSKYRGAINKLWDSASPDAENYLSGKGGGSVASAINQYQAMKGDSGVTDPNFEALIQAKNAISRGANPEAVLKRYQSLQKPATPQAPAGGFPAGQAPAQAPTQPLPAGLQINPSFGPPITQGQAPAAGGQIPAMAGGGVAQAVQEEPEEPEVVGEPDEEDETAEV
jgi:hypothetical protein